MGKVTANLSCMPSTRQDHCWPLHIRDLRDTQEVAAAIPILQKRKWGQFRPTQAGGCDAQVTAKPPVRAGRAFQAGPGDNFILLPHHDT